MKTPLIAVVLFSALQLKSQTDTIFKNDGEIILGHVSEVTETAIKFVYPGESFSNALGKNAVKKIHFKSGRKQDFSADLNISLVKGCQEWNKVQISKIESEVIGLMKLDIIGAKAKGATTWTSLAKLQDRAYNKLKIETAMLGGNVAYILEQNTEEAIFGGEEGSSKTPGVTVSGLAYTSKKVYKHEIKEASYNLASIYMLRANEYEIEQLNVSPQTFEITREEIKETNGFQKLKLNIHDLKKVTEYTVIYADEKELVLSAVYSNRQGKKTYYNIYLLKKAGN
ncbi:MAG: hypothetical protein JNK73_15245 [Bacteroidia bacterium]|nr:hypothetical protein [Bacteroidia bacterium]